MALKVDPGFLGYLVGLGTGMISMLVYFKVKDLTEKMDNM